MKRLAMVVCMLALPADAAAQVVAGRVIDARDGRPVATALVRLVDAEGEPRSFVIADSSGAYRLVIDEAGDYSLAVERIGYKTFQSPLLAFSRPDGTYPIDLQVDPAPLGLPGLTITTNQRAAGDERIRLHVGMDPRSLRLPALTRVEIEKHVAQAHTVVDVVRRMPTPSITVRESTEGPCFQHRQRQCIEVYLDGVHVGPEFVESLPLDLVESFLIISPQESIVYESGAILLFTAGWFR